MITSVNTICNIILFFLIEFLVHVCNISYFYWQINVLKFQSAPKKFARLPQQILNYVSRHISRPLCQQCFSTKKLVLVTFVSLFEICPKILRLDQIEVTRDRCANTRARQIQNSFAIQDGKLVIVIRYAFYFLMYEIRKYLIYEIKNPLPFPTVI